MITLILMIIGGGIGAAIGACMNNGDVLMSALLGAVIGLCIRFVIATGGDGLDDIVDIFSSFD